MRADTCINIKKNDEQPLKLKNIMLIVKEAINFDEYAANLSKRFDLKSKNINQRDKRHKAKGYLIDLSGQPGSLS